MNQGIRGCGKRFENRRGARLLESFRASQALRGNSSPSSKINEPIPSTPTVALAKLLAEDAFPLASSMIANIWKG